LTTTNKAKAAVAVCGSQCGQGGANTSISPEAIQEYRVITHDFNAEYGKGGGFVTDTVLKSGTNQWHGSLFEYNRIQALTANDWFSNNAGLRDHLVRNQFGGSVGGPVYKDKTFFFVTAEAHRLRVSTPQAGTSMTQQFYDFVNSGQMASFVNDQLCEGGCPDLPTTVGPVFQDLLGRFPQAMPLVNSTVDCASDTTGACIGREPTQLDSPIQFQFMERQPKPSSPLDQYRFSVKFDHRISDKDQLSVSYLFEDTKTNNNLQGADTTFGGPLDNPNRAQTAGVTWTHTFAPTVLNQFKIGYVRRKADFFATGAEGVPSLFAIDALVTGFGTSQGYPKSSPRTSFNTRTIWLSPRVNTASSSAANIDAPATVQVSSPMPPVISLPGVLRI
jgi:hypothetical protein